MEVDEVELSGADKPRRSTPDDPAPFVGLSRIFLAFIGKFSLEERLSRFDVPNRITTLGMSPYCAMLITY